MQPARLHCYTRNGIDTYLVFGVDSCAEIVIDNRYLNFIRSLVLYGNTSKHNTDRNVGAT